jgi:hypothetical protein
MSDESLKIEQIAGYIEKAGKSQRVVEVECPYVKGFFVKIAYLSKFLLNQISELARERSKNPRTGASESRFNEEKLREGYVNYIVLDWRGLTCANLQKLLPGLKVDEGQDLNKEITYDRKLAYSLLTYSIEFENWVVSVTNDIENYSAIGEQKKEEFENLKK